MAQAEKRLAAALDYRPATSLDYRPATSITLFEIRTNNLRTGMSHHIEIKHEVDNGSGKFNVYLDGERWRNGWSRTRFIGWLFGQIDYVLDR